MDHRISFFGLIVALMGCFVAPSGAFLELTINQNKKRNDDRVELRQMVFTSLVHENHQKL